MLLGETRLRPTGLAMKIQPPVLPRQAADNLYINAFAQARSTFFFVQEENDFDRFLLATPFLARRG